MKTTLRVTAALIVALLAASTLFVLGCSSPIEPDSRYPEPHTACTTYTCEVVSVYPGTHTHIFSLRWTAPALVLGGDTLYGAHLKVDSAKSRQDSAGWWVDFTGAPNVLYVLDIEVDRRHAELQFDRR